LILLPGGNVWQETRHEEVLSKEACLGDSQRYHCPEEGAMRNTNESTKNVPLPEELMFEYDQLRREILQQDSQSIQVLVGVILLVSGLTTIAFGVAVSSLLVKGILFLLVQVIVCIGLWQTVQRAYISLTIASYLRTFVEPKTTGLRWESRLKKYRRRAMATFRHLRLGEFFNYLLIYIFLIIVNFLFSAGYVIYEMRLSPILNVAIVLLDLSES
jgi:hypothetical protein